MAKTFGLREGSKQKNLARANLKDIDDIIATDHVTFLKRGNSFSAKAIVTKFGY